MDPPWKQVDLAESERKDRVKMRIWSDMTLQNPSSRRHPLSSHNAAAETCKPPSQVSGCMNIRCLAQDCIFQMMSAFADDSISLCVNDSMIQ
jgi:hypothetical protein